MTSTTTPARVSAIGTDELPAVRRSLSFPAGFVWGVATAAYQIEGAAREAGRTPSIWDTFSHTPGKVEAGDTGDVACDHFHRYESDLDLMASLSIASYRFSVSWPRVVPDSSGRINRRGLDFYSRLVDAMLARGIAPAMTLYHWDLPQWAQDEGGWLNRITTERFTDFAIAVGAAVGDRVPTIITLNEPWCSAFLGYGTGGHAPGLRDQASAFQAAHHLNLAHGMAVEALRGIVPRATQLSVSLNLMQAEPATDDPADIAAAAHVDLISNRVFLEPMIRGRYPERLIDQTREVTDWSFVRDADLATINQPIDLLGVNYYSPSRISAIENIRPGEGRSQHGPSATSAWPGTGRAVENPAPGPSTAMGWPVVPDSLTRLLVGIHETYPEVALVITENGAAYDDVVAPDGVVDDPRRVDYVRDHLVAVHAAIDAGVDLRGYYVWSFMDNFEWAWGFGKRFGIVYIDFGTLRRTPKRSAHWYADVIRANAVESVSSSAATDDPPPE